MIVVVDNTLQDTGVMAVYLPKLVQYLVSKKQEYIVVTNVLEFQKVQNKASGIVLSGSPIMIKDLKQKRYAEVLMLNSLAVMTANTHGVPVYGICFGCQFIHHMFGGKLSKLPETVCRNALVSTSRGPLNAHFCCRYVLQEPASSFRVLGYTVLHSKKVPCMVQHESLPLMGTLFHAENNEETHYILEKFLHKCSCVKEFNKKIAT